MGKWQHGWGRGSRDEEGSEGMEKMKWGRMGRGNGADKDGKRKGKREWKMGRRMKVSVGPAWDRGPGIGAGWKGQVSVGWGR